MDNMESLQYLKAAETKTEKNRAFQQTQRIFWGREVRMDYKAIPNHEMKLPLLSMTN